MEFLDYLYLKFRKNFLMALNEITNNDFHLRKTRYKEDYESDYVSYLIQPCEFKYEDDEFPLLVVVQWHQEPMFKLLKQILDGVSPQDAQDFSKETLNIAMGHLKGQVSSDSYVFKMSLPHAAPKKTDIAKYKTFIPMEDSYLISSTDQIYGALSFYFEEE
jgi:hypothetical protein